MKPLCLVNALLQVFVRTQSDYIGENERTYFIILCTGNSAKQRFASIYKPTPSLLYVRTYGSEETLL